MGPWHTQWRHLGRCFWRPWRPRLGWQKWTLPTNPLLEDGTEVSPHKACAPASGSNPCCPLATSPRTRGESQHNPARAMLGLKRGKGTVPWRRCRTQPGGAARQERVWVGWVLRVLDGRQSMRFGTWSLAYGVTATGNVIGLEIISNGKCQGNVIDLGVLFLDSGWNTQVRTPGVDILWGWPQITWDSDSCTGWGGYARISAAEGGGREERLRGMCTLKCIAPWGWETQQRDAFHGRDQGTQCSPSTEGRAGERAPASLRRPVVALQETLPQSWAQWRVEGCTTYHWQIEGPWSNQGHFTAWPHLWETIITVSGKKLGPDPQGVRERIYKTQCPVGQNKSAASKDSIASVQSKKSRWVDCRPRAVPPKPSFLIHILDPEPTDWRRVWVPRRKGGRAGGGRAVPATPWQVNMVMIHPVFLKGTFTWITVHWGKASTQTFWKLLDTESKLTS